ncbi:MAG TPA: aminodeoxychorismate/anthranilate synthase component II [Planctomicrobium sp.]|nr:aminodeoxychorismate/anthranilate synthase component II [Planctomicrobium sp.]
MSSPVLLIDNYDSFVFNLARYFQELGLETDVCRNDARSVAEILASPPAAIVLSPGPSTPEAAGICIELIQKVQGTVPIFGVCLGHQAIGAALGGHVLRAPEPVHGRRSIVEHDGTGLFENCPIPLSVARYHSLIVDRATLPSSLHVTASTTDGLIMGLAHNSWPLFGVQFHPESILTEQGHRILYNFLRLSGVKIGVEFEELSGEGDSLHTARQDADFYQQEPFPDSFRPS